MEKNLLIIMLLFMLCQMNPALADDDSTDYEDNTPLPTVTSMEAFYEMGEQTADSLNLAAEYALDQGKIDKAIKLCKLALDKDYNDIDIHKAYAKAMQEKLKTQKEQDHDLYTECVKEWLIVYRTEVGDERGLSFHGINPLGHLYEDEDRSIPARAQLVVLTGRAPKPWETDAKYLQWVNRPDTSVAGKILNTN